jgi:predicted secreted protein
VIGEARTAAIAALLAAALAGCGGGSGGPSPLQLDNPRGSAPVTLKAGQELVVSFQVNYGIGTDWAIGPKPTISVLRYRGAAYQARGPQLPGSGGNKRFSFQARAKGRTPATFLHYFRGKLTERRVLTVVVR